MKNKLHQYMNLLNFFQNDLKICLINDHLLIEILNFLNFNVMKFQ